MAEYIPTRRETDGLRDEDADEKPAETPNEALLRTARECYRVGVDAIKDQVDREKDDLRCQVPDLMWPDDVRGQRAGQVVGGVALPPRPMISIPSLDQPVQLVLNQEKAAHLGVQIHALSEDADDDTAEILQGLYRRIEVDSRAGIARSWAYERAVKAGRGAYRVLTEYADDGGHFTDQKITIKRLLHQEAAVFDPFAQEPDWSDGRWAFVTEWVPFSRYKVQYPDSDLATKGYEQLDEFFGDIADDQRPRWIKGEGEARAVLLCEYFYLEYTTRKKVRTDDGEDVYEDELPDGQRKKTYARERVENIPQLKWVKFNGAEIIEGPEDRDGRYIPIIPVIGRELQPFNDDRVWVGIYGPNKEAARMLNYAASGAIEMAALETKAPYVMYAGQDEGFKTMWLQANVRNFPALYVNPSVVLPGGQPAPLPQRTQVDVSRLGPSMTLLGMAREFIQSGTGAFREALGQADPANKTKGGILALQDQHLRGNSHFLDNLAQISITYEAKVVLDLIPYVYDRPGRVARTLDFEDNVKTVMLNRAFVPGANGRPQAIDGPDVDQRVADKNDPAKRYDLKKGTYGVAVSVGKARESRLEEGSDSLGALFQANPALFQLFGDIWLKFQTWPGHVEAAERAKKMLPPQLQQQDDENPAAAEQKLAQAEQALQQLQQQMQQMAKALETDQVKYAAQAQIAQFKEEKAAEVAKFKESMAIQLQQMKDATAIRIKEIDAQIKGLQIGHDAEHEALALAIEVNEAAKDRAHEVGMSAMGGQQALDAGQQGHAQALEQQALAPPTNGNGSGL